jgi:hypothetical protein
MSRMNIVTVVLIDQVPHPVAFSCNMYVIIYLCVPYLSNKPTVQLFVKQDCRPLAPVQNSAAFLVSKYRFHVQLIVEGTYIIVQRSVIFFILRLSTLS